MSVTKDKKIKIAFVLPALTAGGAERVLITLMNSIDRTRFEPIFVTVSDTGTLRKIIDPEIPFHCLQKERVSLALPKMYFKLKDLDPDIIFSTMAHLNLSLLLLKPLFPKTHFIVREAITPSFILGEHRYLSFALKAAYRHLYPKAAQVIDPAQAIIHEFQELLGMSCKNHVLLHNPVDLDKIREKEDIKFEIAQERNNTVHFVSAGRLHFQKGFDRLVEALPDMNLPYDWSWTILGEGPERNHLENLIQKSGLADKISLPGLSHHPWPSFAAADCFLMPSRWEGLPNVALESLACGTPVIATHQSGGIAEIAKLSSEGAVSVADSMANFVAAMEKVIPASTKTFRDSLLPDVFQKENVTKCFEDILEEVVAS
ncbi:MAG: glycosyl transferase [Micavibrio sp.]|nr:MAG: glycosyl transferase [Micavibrio sp.]